MCNIYMFIVNYRFLKNIICMLFLFNVSSSFTFNTNKMIISKKHTLCRLQISNHTNSSESLLLSQNISDFDSGSIKVGMKQDWQILLEDRSDIIVKIKNSGTAGIISYAMTEGIFWLLSIPVAISIASFNNGGVPDMSTQEGLSIVSVYSVALITFSRCIVPIRIALALALTPWVDDKILSKFSND